MNLLTKLIHDWQRANWRRLVRKRLLTELEPDLAGAYLIEVPPPSIWAKCKSRIVYGN
jgi:hypothetical protein